MQSHERVSGSTVCGRAPPATRNAPPGSTVTCKWIARASRPSVIAARAWVAPWSITAGVTRAAASR
jgi:hypothetical protein